MATHSERWATYAAAWLPLLVYAYTAAGHGYWLDSPEFTAAAVGLDIPHPPGHPLFSLWSKPFTLLPLGPLPYRVAVGEAVAAALALGAVQVAIARSLARSGLSHVTARSLLSLTATLTLAAAYGFWFQATRAEVYALEAMLVCCALERLTWLACSERVDDPRPLYAACLALGFGLANHHLIAILALPALGYALVQLVRARGLAVLGMSLLAGSAGLFCYAYLPLRAATYPLMDLGHPVSWRDFSWVVSAQVYARHIGSEALQPLGERFADLVVILAENFTLPVLPLALLGSYALLRSRRTWPLAYVWLVTVLSSLCGRAWLNPVRGNPDVLGYMMPGFAALLALAATGVATLLAALPSTLVGRRILLCAVCLLTLLGPAQVLREAERASLRSFHASDAVDDLRRRALPSRALVVLVTPDVVFRHWEGEVTEQLRHDVTMLPLPFVGYGGLDGVLAQRQPELRPLLDAYLARGELSDTLLRALARERPVFVELDTSTALPLLPYLVPEGLLFRVLPERPTTDVVVSAGQLRLRNQAELLLRLADDLHDPETSKHLLWIRYVEALYFAWHGALELARASTADGLRLAPRTTQLLALRRALAQSSSVPFDVRPFLVRHAAPALRTDR
ncbi:MAG: hypothetical protein JWN04_3611 [Myxococcaceae bacterium]|nr:hypothetical protein [Myxococcaceae bacterium]